MKNHKTTFAGLIAGVLLTLAPSASMSIDPSCTYSSGASCGTTDGTCPGSYTEGSWTYLACYNTIRCQRLYWKPIWCGGNPPQKCKWMLGTSVLGLCQMDCDPMHTICTPPDE